MAPIARTADPVIQAEAPLPGHHRHPVQALGSGLEAGCGRGIALQRPTGRPGGLFVAPERGRQLGKLLRHRIQPSTELRLLRRGYLQSGADRAQLPATEVQPEGLHLGLEAVVALVRVGLAAQRSHPAALLTEDVLEAGDVQLGLFQPPLRSIAPQPMLDDTSRLLDHGTMLLGAGVEDLPDATLADDHVLVTADAAVGEQLLDVQQPASCSVDQVLGCAVAVQAAGERHLGEVERQQALPVVECERYLGPGVGGASRRP